MQCLRQCYPPQVQCLLHLLLEDLVQLQLQLTSGPPQLPPQAPLMQLPQLEAPPLLQLPQLEAPPLLQLQLLVAPPLLPPLRLPLPLACTPWATGLTRLA